MDEKFKKAFIKGSAAATLGTLISMGFHLFSIGILTRVLPKEAFGGYVIFLIIVNFFNLVSSLGLNITLVKFISNDKLEENKSSLRAIMITRVYTLIFLAVSYYFISDFVMRIFDLKISSLSYYIPIMFILSSYKDLFYNVLQGLNEYKKFSLVQITSALSRLLLIIAAVYYNMLTLDNLIFIEIITSITAIISQLLCFNIRKLTEVKAGKQVYKSIFKFSLPLYLNSLLTFSYDRLSLFIIGIFLNPVSVAIYDIGNKIPDALMRMFAPFIIVFFPNSAKLFSQGNHKAGVSLMNKSLNVFSVGIAILTFIAFLFSKEIIVTMFSAAYLPSAAVFALLMVNFYLRVMSNIMGYSVVSAGYAAIPVKVNAVASVVNLGISVLAIPAYGYIGAVYAILIMNIISQVFYHLYAIKVNLHPEGYKYLYPFFLMVSIVAIQHLIGIEMFYLKVLLTLIFIVLNWFLITEFKQLVLTSLGFLKKVTNKLKFSV